MGAFGKTVAVVMLLNGTGAYAQGGAEAGTAVAQEAAQEAYYLDLAEGEKLRVLFTLEATGSETGPGGLAGAVPGNTVRLIGVEYPDKVELPWGHALKPVDYWQGLEGRIRGALMGYFTPPVAEAPPPSGPEETAGSEEPALAVGSGPLPGLAQVDISSKALQDAHRVTSVLGVALPGEVTAAAAMTTGGLVLMDELGGHAGVSVVMPGLPLQHIFKNVPLAAMPLSAQLIVVPRDPKTFLKNLAEVSVRPDKQLQLAGKVTKQVVLKPAGAALQVITRIPQVAEKPVQAASSAVRDVGRCIRKLFRKC